MPRILLSTALLASAVATVWLWAQSDSAAESTPPAAEPSLDGGTGTSPRILYSPGHLPHLSLPGGEVRVVRSLLNVPGRMRFGDYVWNDAAVPPGRLWVRIDLARQTMSVFRGADEIGTTVILYGADGKPTPTGIFPVLEKARHHRSTLYDAEMPYMMRLTGDGVAIHASNVRERSATHGCIGVPPAFAARLFGEIKRGDPVAIIGTAKGQDRLRPLRV